MEGGKEGGGEEGEVISEKQRSTEGFVLITDNKSDKNKYLPTFVIPCFIPRCYTYPVLHVTSGKT